MNLKDVKLGKKLGLGFAVILTIMAALGITAIISMDLSSKGSDKLAKMYMPEVAEAIDVQKSSLLTMYAMRGFTMSEDETYWAESQNLLSELKTSHLKDAKALADKFPQLVKLRGNIEKATAAVEQYTSLSNKAREIHGELKEVRLSMDESAKKFMENASQYLEDQNKKLSAQIASQASPLAMNDGLIKITGINDVIDLGNNIRVMNFKAQAGNDLAILGEAIKEFPKIDKILNKIRVMTIQEKDLHSLDLVKKETDNYHKAITEFYNDMDQLQKLNSRLDAAANQVVAVADTTAEAGMTQAQKHSHKKCCQSGHGYFDNSFRPDSCNSSGNISGYMAHQSHHRSNDQRRSFRHQSGRWRFESDSGYPPKR